MSAPTPQKIRDRLGLAELTLNQTWEELAKDEEVDADTCIFLLSAKAQALHATAVTLLVDQQRIANRLAVAQVWATLGESRTAREILQEIGDV